MERGGKEPLLSARTYNNFQFKGNLNHTHSGRGSERAGASNPFHMWISHVQSQDNGHGQRSSSQDRAANRSEQPFRP